jgi:hypothetical protein
MESYKFGRSQYFSGQGIVYAGIAGDPPERLLPLGNVTALTLDATEEYQTPTYSREGVLLPGVPELVKYSATFSATVESLSSENIALIWRQQLQPQKRENPASITKTIRGFHGGVTKIPPADDAPLLEIGASEPIQYTVPGAPWNYRLDRETGMLQFNDGSAEDIPPFADIDFHTFYAPLTSVDGLHRCKIATTVPNLANIQPGQRVLLYKVGGVLGGKITAVAEVVAKYYDCFHINFPANALPAGNVQVTPDGFPVQANLPKSRMTEKVGSLVTVTEPITFLRFAGLNVVTSGEKRIVDIYRTKVKPAGMLALINDGGVAAIEMSGAVLPKKKPFGQSVYFEHRRTV